MPPSSVDSRRSQGAPKDTVAGGFDFGRQYWRQSPTYLRACGAEESKWETGPNQSLIVHPARGRSQERPSGASAQLIAKIRAHFGLDRGLGRRPPAPAIVPLDPADPDRPIISNKNTRLLAFAGIHPWQYWAGARNWNDCRPEDFLLAVERYQRCLDTPEGKEMLFLKVTGWAGMNEAATIISACVRGYLTRRAYFRFLCPPVLAENAQEAPPPAIDAQLVGRIVWVLCTEEQLPARPEHYSGAWWLGGKITKYRTPEEAQQTVMEDHDLQDAHFNVEWTYSDDMADWAMSSWLDLDKYDPYVVPEREPLAAGAWYLEEVCP